MESRAVCGVVVTYHPDTSMLGNILSARKQMHAVVVVDNGSNPDEVNRLRECGQRNGLNLIENQENVGIAEGLNQGVRWAKDEGFPWVILLDQDSVMTDAFIDNMFAAWDAHPQRERVCSVHPRYVDPRTGIEPRVLRAPDGGPITSITSGSMLPTWAFDRVGWFASDFFIDWVDIEYCLRIRAAGFLVADSRAAILWHRAGNSTFRSIFGFRFQPSHHSATRRYYMSRNRIVVFRRYFRKFPSWVLSLMFEAFRETVKCFISEKDLGNKLRSFLLGTIDGFRGRMGKREGV